MASVKIPKHKSEILKLNKGAFISLRNDTYGKVYVFEGHEGFRSSIIGIDLTEYEDDVVIYRRKVPTTRLYPISDTFVNYNGILARISSEIKHSDIQNEILPIKALFKYPSFLSTLYQRWE